MTPTYNNNLSVLPWYNSLDEQNSRKSYSYGDIYPLFAEANKLLPFQIIRETRTNAISFVRLYDKTGKLIEEITQPIIEAGLQIVRFEQWWDVENLVFDAGQIVYQNPNFRNVLYLCTELGKPDYVFEEEGEERDGYFFPEKQISEKTYKCTILAPEYLCDVMRFIRMADYVVVTDKYGRKYNCDTFLITPKWQTQGNLASVEIEFQTDTVVKKIGRGYIISNKGDFNGDFNNDFNNN